MNFVQGLSTDAANVIIARRGDGYDGVRDLWLRTGLSSAMLKKLADADAFNSLALSRRDAGWAVDGLKGPNGVENLRCSPPDGQAKAMNQILTYPLCRQVRKSSSTTGH